MTDKKLIELVDRIEARTLAGELSWEKTAAEDTFQATLTSFVLRISRSQFEGTLEVMISLMDKDGTDVESISDRALKRLMEENNVYGQDAFHKMERIFKHARRKALNVDQALDDVLSELG